VTNHVQCLLERATIRQIAWIPDKLAVEGNYVQLNDKEFGWSNGWCVRTVFHDTALDSRWVQDRSRDYTKQRQMSDI
jgi:hypothetical protein